MGQTLSFAATYELKLTPSLFTYDNKTETDTQVEISEEHVDKISAYVSTSGFKSEIAAITKVSVEAVHLTFDPSSIKYNADDNAVTITGKWNHGTKQAKKSVKRAKHAGGGSGSGAKRSLVSSQEADADENKNNDNPGSDDDLDIKVSDVLAEIKNELHREAYLETEISKQAHLFICFSEDIDMSKI
jgi:hypothetical protein